MKKKALLTLCLLTALCVLSACSALPLTTLRSMFPDGDGAPAAAVGEDSVVISKAAYERYRKFDTLIEMMDMVDERFYEEADEETMLQGAAAGLLSALGDPYTFYYTPDEFAKLWEDDEGHYVGIGVMIQASYVTNLCTITRVFKGGPAEAAGVQKGDILYRVGEDLYVTAQNLDEAVSIMRGVEGTDVDVTFLRKGEEMTFTITRRGVIVNRIESGVLENDIGYICLYEFAGDSDREFKEALDELMEKNIKSLIIDLRGNGGGWVDHAQSIGDLFLDSGVLCYMEDKHGERKYYYTTEGKVDIPLTILVDQNTASASEILTGALQDRAGATVVGVQSYGKGIVQQVQAVGTQGAGMQITIEQYYTPNGNAVHKIGITPDVICEMPDDAPTMYDFGDLSDVQLKKAYDVALEKIQP